MCMAASGCRYAACCNSRVNMRPAIGRSLVLTCCAETNGAGSAKEKIPAQPTGPERARRIASYRDR